MIRLDLHLNGCTGTPRKLPPPTIVYCGKFSFRNTRMSNDVRVSSE